MSTKYGLQVESMYTLTDFQPVIITVQQGEKKVIDRGGVPGLLAIRVERGATLEYKEYIQSPGLFHTYVYILGEDSKVSISSSICISDGVSDISHKIFHECNKTTSYIKTKGVLTKTAEVIYTSEIKAEKLHTEIVGDEKAHFLVSDFARVSGIPELSIFTNDVVCAHSLSISPIPENQVLYMASKGYTYEEAKQMIMNSFLKI